MKRIILIILSVFLIIVMFGCGSPNQTNMAQTKELDVREIVYNKLTSSKKEQIKGTWKDSKLSKIVLNGNPGVLYDQSFWGKEVYLVDFTTKKVRIPNNMTVYASTEDYKIIGYGVLE
jgi:hypothetical protein